MLFKIIPNASNIGIGVLDTIMIKVCYGFIYFIFCILQPICLPIPEAMTIYFGSELIGSFASFILGFIGSLIGISIMYAASKYGSKKLLHKFAGNNRIERYRKYTEKRAFLLTSILFVIPVLPDEIVCIGAALIGISYRQLFLIAAPAKLISISMISYSNFIGTVLGITKMQVIVFEVTILLFIAFLIKMKKGDYKNNEADEVKEY